VHRDGKASISFNGQPCRLKASRSFHGHRHRPDELFHHGQGQIDQILSSKPEERRAVFEEAAGITKYKSAGVRR